MIFHFLRIQFKHVNVVCGTSLCSFLLYFITSCITYHPPSNHHQTFCGSMISPLCSNAHFSLLGLLLPHHQLFPFEVSCHLLWGTYSNLCSVLHLDPSYTKTHTTTIRIHTVQFNSVTQSCLTLCDPMNCKTPGLPVHHQLLEFTQTHAHQVNDAIQPSHPLSSPSPPAPNPSHHQGIFQ